ncbi:4Fe-4S dicluster domain-containing protein [Pseudodesulfovibrio piezophilus]|uniref:4Fe-4S ferredoxin iron-sulfur binding domain protein n=1 Tax=Pseudodesulfovibrio piezophilus (strain DSM 21447 / JCM 15486 / C1TLV30) TaxID=1322246 RepID=M1WY59_PSEP2|nr:4Fe-4S dicluster domain-containing protein [Pseudodesulfovibrio piezophilus]CCH50143.1 4Fe-4S ferredoxin iron-sulfur binding domain protein [Pseudodesulfovibrio piezophilus C1TLV30]
MAIYKIKFDKTRCIACDACLVHCKVKNKVPAGISLNRLTAEGPLADKDGKPTAKLKYQPCLHCKKPGCVPACPTGAMYQREDGLVLVDLDKCDGCQSCIDGCPWQVPVYNEMTGKIMKCDYCVDRVDAGGIPACVTGCTANALSFVRPE